MCMRVPSSPSLLLWSFRFPAEGMVPPTVSIVFLYSQDNLSQTCPQANLIQTIPYSDSFFRLFQVLSIDNLSQMLSMYCDVATSTAKTHADITTQYNISKGCFCSFFYLYRESFVWYLLLSLLNLRTFINSEILISVQIEPSLFFLLFFSCNFYLIFSRLSLLISMVLKIIILCLLFPISSKHQLQYTLHDKQFP